MSQAPEQRGDERVLYLHSTGTTPSMWRRVPPAAFGGAVGLAPAHIGYPPNPPLPRGAVCRAEEDAAQALAALPPGVTGVHLVGHSYGALVALHVAQALGPRVRSVFLYEPVVFGALLHDDVVLDPKVRDEVRGFVNHPWFLTDEARLGSDEWLELFIDYWNHPGAWRGMPEAVKAATRGLSWKMVQEVRSCFFSAGRFSSGLPAFQASSWNGLAAPAKTPRPVIDRLNKEVAAALAKPDVRKKLADLNIDADPSTPDEASQLLAADIKRWGAVIDKAGVPKQ